MCQLPHSFFVMFIYPDPMRVKLVLNGGEFGVTSSYWFLVLMFDSDDVVFTGGLKVSVNNSHSLSNWKESSRLSKATESVSIEIIQI